MELSQASDQKGGWVRLKPDTTYGRFFRRLPTVQLRWSQPAELDFTSRG
jgi:hypothetical protein